MHNKHLWNHRTDSTSWYKLFSDIHVYHILHIYIKCWSLINCNCSKMLQKSPPQKKKHPSFSKTQALPRPWGFFCRFSALFWKGQNTGRCEDPIQKKTRRGNQITNCLVQKQANFEKWLFIKFAVCKRKSRNHLKKYYHPPKTNMTM